MTQLFHIKKTTPIKEIIDIILLISIVALRYQN